MFEDWREPLELVARETHLGEKRRKRDANATESLELHGSNALEEPPDRLRR